VTTGLWIYIFAGKLSIWNASILQIYPGPKDQWVRSHQPAVCWIKTHWKEPHFPLDVSD